MLSEIIRIRLENALNQKIFSHKKISAGYVNSLYIVKFRHDSYIVKVYNRLIPIEQIMCSVNVQKYLSMENLSPKIITIINDIEPIIAVQEYMVSYSNIVTTNDNYYYSIGLLLGRIHQALHYYQNPFAKVYDQCGILKIINSNAELSTKQLCLLDKKIKLKKYINDIPSIEKQVIHGDYYNENILICGCNYCAIDFDESKIYYRVYDIIKVIVNIIRIFRFDKAKIYVNSFLFGYGKHVQLLKQEVESMVDIYLYTLSNETSGLTELNCNMDDMYLDKRISLHEFVLSELKIIRSLVNSFDYVE